MTTSADRLLSKEKLHAKLYDVGSMMELHQSVASGFIVLLNGGPASTTNNENEGTLPLAFMSLTSGNVIDACFGVKNPSKRDDTPTRRSAREAKMLIDEHDTTDSFRQIAVSAYCEAFKAVIIYNEQMNKLNCFTRCFRSKKIRSENEEKIRSAFDSLVVAIGDSNYSN
jgi:hypothetical protein